jgi:hypothetical protein
VDLQKRKSILDAEDAVKIHFINVIMNAQAVDSQRLNEENTLGLNGTHRCKRLF